MGKITDNYFKKEVQKKKKSESEFFEAEKEVRVFAFSLYIQSFHAINIKLVLLDA